MANSDSLYSASNNKERGSKKIDDEEQHKETGSDDEHKENALSNNCNNTYLERVRKQRRSVQKRLIELGLIDKRNFSGGIISRLSQQHPSPSRNATSKTSNN